MKKFIQNIKCFFIKAFVSKSLFWRWFQNDHPLQKGCYVGWNKKALEDDILWSATNKGRVKVRDITTGAGAIWGEQRTIHFEAPLEKNWSGEKYSVFECWLEHKCKTAKNNVC